MTPAAPLTAAYRAALNGTNAALLARIGYGFNAVFSDDAPLGTLAALSRTSAPWISGAQQLAAQQSAGYLAALTARAAGAPLATVAPYAIPAGLVGSTAAGIPMADLTGVAPRVWWARLQAGASRAEAAQAAGGWLGMVATSELSRAANATVLHNAVADDRLTGRISRIVTGTACSFCALIRDRGYTRAAAGFAAHPNCACTAEPEIDMRKVAA